MAVDLRDVTAGYRSGAPVLNGLSARFPARGLTHVRGRNGSGKSTVVELCSGYLRPWSGSVLVAGRDAADPDVRRHRRVCRTRPALYPRMTVHDHLVLAARCAGTDPADAQERAARLGLDRWLDTDASALSTGNARKLWYVMCTLGRFDVVLLDEPFLGLDDDGVAVVVGEIAEWAARGAVVLVGHDLPDALHPTHVHVLGPHEPTRPNEQ